MSDHQTALFQELVRAREIARDIEQAHGKYFPDVPYTDARSSFHLFVRRAKRDNRATDILRGLVDAVAGKQEDLGELVRALGTSAPHWIERARALLREVDE